MSDLGEARVGVKADAGTVSAELSKIAASFIGIKAAAGPAALALVGVGVAFVGISAAIGVLSDATQKFAEFEQSIVNAASKTGEFEAAQVRFAAAAIDAGLATAFSAAQAADALDILATAGFRTDEATGALPGVLQLAQAGMLSLADAADITAVAMRGYGFAADELGRVNDVLVSAFTGANQTASELGQALQKAGPIASVLGQEFETTVATLSLLADAGFKAEEGGTALKVAFARLAKPTKQVSAALGNLRVKTKNADGTMRDFIAIMGDLERAGADAGDFVAIFGQRSGPTLAALLVQGNDKLLEFENRLRGAGGAAAEMEKRQLATLGSQFKILQGTIETVAIAFGQTLAPVIKPLVSAFQKMLQSSFKSGKALEVFRKVTIASAGTLITLIDIVEALAPPFIAWATGLRVIANVQQIVSTAVIALGRVIVGFVTIALGAFIDGVGGIIQVAAQAANALNSDLGPALDAAGAEIAAVGKEIGEFGDDFIDLDGAIKSTAEDMGDIDDALTSMAGNIDDTVSVTSQLRGALMEGQDALKGVTNGAFLASVALAKFGDETDKAKKKAEGAETAFDKLLSGKAPKIGPILSKIAREFGSFEKALQAESDALDAQLESFGAGLVADFEREQVALAKAASERDAAMDEAFLLDRAATAEFNSFLMDGLGNFGSSIADALGGGEIVGAISGIVSGAMTGASLGGPAGAVAGGLLAAGSSLVELAANTKAFERITARVSGQFSESFAGFDQIGEKFAKAAEPIGELFVVVIEALEPIADLFGDNIFETVARALFEGFGAFLQVILAIAETIIKVVRAITFIPSVLLDVIAFILDTLNDVLEFFGIDALADITASVTDAADSFNDFRSSLETIDDAIDDAQSAVSALSFDEAKANADAAREAAKQGFGTIFPEFSALSQVATLTAGSIGSLNSEISQALTNVPTGAKLALAQFNATDRSGAPLASSAQQGGFVGFQGPTAASQGIFIENLTIQGSSMSDLDQLERSILDDGKWDTYRSTGAIPTYARFLGRELGS